MRFFVPGGAGYVGSHFIHEAKRRGHECVILDSLERGHKESVPPGVKLIEANIKDEAAVAKALAEAKPDIIVHYAAYALVGESVQFPQMYFDNNLGGVEALQRAMVKAGCIKPFIFSSTCAVFGAPKKLPMVENDPKAPMNPYGESKLLAEKVIEAFCALNKSSAFALRYFNACGADASGLIGEDHEPESHLLPNILRAVSQGKEVTVFGNDYPTPDGSCVRDYIHVTDLALAHLAAAEFLLKKAKPGQFEAVHIATGQGYSNFDVIKTVEKVLQLKVKMKIGERRPGDPPELYAENKKAKTLLGFSPQHSSLENIVKTAWKWHKSHPNGYQSSVPS